MIFNKPLRLNESITYEVDMRYDSLRGVGLSDFIRRQDGKPTSSKVRFTNAVGSKVYTGFMCIWEDTAEENQRLVSLRSIHHEYAIPRVQIIHAMDVNDFREVTSNFASDLIFPQLIANNPGKPLSFDFESMVLPTPSITYDFLIQQGDLSDSIRRMVEGVFESKPTEVELVPISKVKAYREALGGVAALLISLSADLLHIPSIAPETIALMRKKADEIDKLIGVPRE